MYDMLILDPTEGKWIPICKPDSNGECWAIPVKNLVHEWKHWNPSATEITLGIACTSGAIGKCLAWGFDPFADDSVKNDECLSCVRMVRADYCGDGISYTISGEIIGFIIPGRKMSRLPNHWVFEAAWGPDGANCVNTARVGYLEEEARKRCPGLWETTCNRDAASKRKDTVILSFIQRE